MKFTLNWLKKHLDTTASAQEICAKLTSIGLELESFEDRSLIYAPFRVAYVESAQRHPDADKLQVCMVKTEKGLVQVVCGAPNARTGMKAVFAPDGTYIPGLDITLKKTKIRGVESNGMLVSEREMCLSDAHEGIIEVDPAIEIGTPLGQIYGLDEQLIEIGLTPNRVDCAGVRGIARDLAATGIGNLKPIDHSPYQGSFESPVGVSILDEQGCPLFLGRMLKGIKNGPSPLWLQNLLKSVGLRPISALVDITNLMTLEYGRPLHVFDADKLKGNIQVRSTQGGEVIETLNGKSYEMTPGAVGIYDDSGLIGIGGIVGGVSTGCDENTINVFLEAAYFSPTRIARAGRDLQIESDARYRFERGIDPEFTAPGIEIATRLILELCATPETSVSHVVRAGQSPEWKRQIEFECGYVRKLCGINVEADKQVDILQKLGFTIEKNNDNFLVSPPSWRGDIDGRADLVEEIVRINGYDLIPPVSVRNDSAVTRAAETQTLCRVRTARAAMTMRGLDECVTWSFMPKALAQQFGSNDNPALSLSNPISSELNQMRPSILPNLIQAAGKNVDRGYGDIGLCEAGPVFRNQRIDGQDMVAAGVRIGQKNASHWAADQVNRMVDVYDAKADALSVLEACGGPAGSVKVNTDAPSYYHPGRSGSLVLGKNVLALFGEIHPAVLDEMGIKQRVVGFEVFLQNIPEARKKDGTAKPLLSVSLFQPLTRDFAFVVSEKTEGDALVKAALSADKNLITSVSIFDVYQGKGIEDGKKSIALSVVIEPRDATLTDEQIEELSRKIIDAVAEKTGATLRR